MYLPDGARRTGAGAPPNSTLSSTGGGSTAFTSMVLRSANWIFPSVAAIVNFAASSGETSRVITGTVWGFPSLSCSIFCPAARTRTFSRIVRVMLCDRPLGSAAVTRTSTIVPGITNPATATTSFTATETARMPSGIVAGSPAPAASGASLPSRMGSFSATEVITARFAQSWMRVNMPATGSPSGHGISLTLRESSGVPSASGMAATTICVVAGFDTSEANDAFLKAWYTKALNAKATTTASVKPIISRLFINKVSLVQLSQAPPSHCKTGHCGCRNRDAEGHLQQPGIIERYLPIGAESEDHEASNQDENVMQRRFQLLGLHRLHECHQSGCKHAPHQDEQEQHWTQEGPHRRHQLPIAGSERPQQNKWKQEKQSQARSFKRHLGAGPSPDYRAQTYTEKKAGNRQPVGNPARAPVEPAGEDRVGQGEYPNCQSRIHLFKCC